MYDDEELQLVATTEPAAIEDIQEDKPQKDLIITRVDGTIHIEGDTNGMWMFVYDVYGNLWYEQAAADDWIYLPGQRVYIVRVGDFVRKIILN